MKVITERWQDWVPTVLAGSAVLIGLWLVSNLLLFCLHRQPTSPRLTSDQADRLAMTLIEANFNASQTNWTMTITQRTNTNE